MWGRDAGHAVRMASEAPETARDGGFFDLGSEPDRPLNPLAVVAGGEPHAAAELAPVTVSAGFEEHRRGKRRARQAVGSGA